MIVLASPNERAIRVRAIEVPMYVLFLVLSQTLLASVV